MGFSTNKSIKCLSALTAAVVLAGSFSHTVLAQKFPNKPVQVVVPFKPGGGADRTFRLFAPYLAKE